jgi:hypothetical protein
MGNWLLAKANIKNQNFKRRTAEKALRFFNLPQALKR